jgi:hypothetical protein
MEIFYGVIPCVTNEGFGCTEFVCEVVDELAEWEYLKVSVEDV